MALTYPSGKWYGYWDQEDLGRQPMHDLELTFSGTTIEGRGRDCIGRFTFAGTCAQDYSVSLVKQYVDAHTVLYHGQHDGEGVISGRWSIGSWYSGPFALRPAAFTSPPDAPIREIA